MKNYFKLLRLTQWIKNVIVFLPIIFHGAVMDYNKVAAAGIAFLSFCCLASSIYIVNDLADAEKDRKHPTKCKRPIASGSVTKRQALAIAAVLWAVAIALCTWMHANLATYIILGAYWVLNLGYSVLGWKNIPVLDLCILASGFLFRLMFGAYATEISVSVWLYLVVLCGAFLCGFGKRRGELLCTSETTRSVLEKYTPSFLSNNMYASMVLMIVFFSLWCLEKGYELLIPFLIIICFRYSYDVEQGIGEGDPTTIICRDKILLAMGLLFGGGLLAVTYIL